MQHLSLGLRRGNFISEADRGCQDQVRFFALHRIKPHVPPLVRAPVNSFEFHSCEHTPQAGYFTRLLQHCMVLNHATLSIHCLRLRLQGYLIPFAPLAFVVQCQYEPSRVLSPLAFFPISTYFTIPPEIPSAPTILKLRSFGRNFKVKP